MMTPMKKGICPALLLALTAMLMTGTFALAEDFSRYPVEGKITMIDLGAKKCIPCKMMAPILATLETAYGERADIVFIDVWENRDQAQRFKISAIPTQIFFNARGKEVYRHVGFLDEHSIIAQLAKMGVKAPESGDKG